MGKPLESSTKSSKPAGTACSRSCPATSLATSLKGPSIPPGRVTGLSVPRLGLGGKKSARFWLEGIPNLSVVEGGNPLPLKKKRIAVVEGKLKKNEQGPLPWSKAAPLQGKEEKPVALDSDSPHRPLGARPKSSLGSPACGMGSRGIPPVTAKWSRRSGHRQKSLM